MAAREGLSRLFWGRKSVWLYHRILVQGQELYRERGMARAAARKAWQGGGEASLTLSGRWAQKGGHAKRKGGRDALPPFRLSS